jgi:hypothetical protein
MHAQARKYLTIAASLWNQSAAELIICPRRNMYSSRVQKAIKQASSFHATVLVVLCVT